MHMICIRKTSERERDKKTTYMHVMDIQKTSRRETLYAYNGHSENIRERKREMICT